MKGRKCVKGVRPIRQEEKKKQNSAVPEVRTYDSVLDLLEDLERNGVTGAVMERELNRFMNLQARMQGIPFSVGFELTPLCNFDCKMCYVHLTKTQMEQEGTVLSTEQWLSIMKQAVEAGMLYADITGGECLTHPGFKKLYLYLQSQGVKVAVLTNGALITEDIADFFAQHPPELVQMTVYGSSEDDYQRVTGHRAFEDVCAAIERLKKRNIRLRLTVTPSRYLQKDIHTLLTFLREQGVEYGIGGVSIPAREDTGRAFEDFAPESELYVQMDLEEEAYHDSFAESVSAASVKRVERIPRNYKPINALPCSSGQSTCHINWKGEMQPCISFHTVTSSVLKHGFASAWEEIKGIMTTYRPPEKCQDCKLLPSCRTCAAEKTFGVLNGEVNQAVCRRCACQVEAGILSMPEQQQCP